MSTIKSSAEHLTLNADGSSKDIKFQANGVEKASISSAGAFTSTTIDATALTGTIPNFTSTGIDDNADATAITIDSSENVGIGVTPESTNIHSSYSSIDIAGGGALAGHSAGNGMKILGNSYRTASGYAYKNTDKASLYANDDGLHEFKVAPSGSADTAISWTTAMTIDNSGNLLVDGSVQTPDIYGDLNNAQFTNQYSTLVVYDSGNWEKKLRLNFGSVPSWGSALVSVRFMYNYGTSLDVLYHVQSHSAAGSLTVSVVSGSAGSGTQWTTETTNQYNLELKCGSALNSGALITVCSGTRANQQLVSTLL